jgi:hypothetical protein
MDQIRLYHNLILARQWQPIVAKEELGWQKMEVSIIIEIITYLLALLMRMKM